jgi:DNA-binding transcriptional regulator YiaG
VAYHYRESGLDNVFLENGYEQHQTPYGKGASIQDVEGLHKAIGLWLANEPVALTGAALRFLRIEMELTQRALAGILGATEQTLRLWERGRKKAIPGPADRLLRALYIEYAQGASSVRQLVDRLAELDTVAHATAHMRETPEGWRVHQPTLVF